MRNPLPEVKTAYFPLKGGEDMVTAPLSISPGALLLSVNYEPAMSHGYRRIDGFERRDGQAAPSGASYWTLAFTAGQLEPVAGNQVVGPSGSGIVLGVVVDTGTWVGLNAAGTLILFDVTGTFADTHALTISASPFATAAGGASERSYVDAAVDATWYQAAIAARRARIAAVAGSGSVRGVWMYKGVAYAFRDNGGGTAGGMWKETTAGWVAVGLGYRISFTAGTNEMVEGGTLTQGGNTAGIQRVVVQTGDWSTNNAVGYMILSAAGNPAPFAAGAATDGATGACTLAGAEAEQTLPAGGRYEFVNYNFFAGTDTLRMYGVNGGGRAFEFDGTVFTLIDTNMGALDKPIHVHAHKFHLFLAFDGGSVQHSAIGEPLVWHAISGAGEIGIGDDVTGFAQVPDALGIFSRNKTNILYGAAVDEFLLKPHSDEVGAVEWSIQSIGMPRYLSDRGLMGLAAAQEYGDFSAATFSELVQPYLLQVKALVVASMRIRDKDQYRIFLADGSGLIAKFRSRKPAEFTRIDYGIPVACTASVEDNDGNEVLLFGSSNGMVYQADVGTSFDGENIEAMARLPFGHLKSPQHNKRFRKVVLEMEASPGTALTFAQEYDYGSLSIPRGLEQTLSIEGGGGIFGLAEWRDFIWGGPLVGTAEAHLMGSGVTIGMWIRSVSSTVNPHTLHGVILHYSLRGRKR